MYLLTRWWNEGKAEFPENSESVHEVVHFARGFLLCLTIFTFFFVVTFKIVKNSSLQIVFFFLRLKNIDATHIYYIALYSAMISKGMQTPEWFGFSLTLPPG
jgi:hypothetical protein